MLPADPGLFRGQLAPCRRAGQPRHLKDRVIASEPDPSPVGDLDGMPAGERPERGEREDIIVEVEAAIGEAIPGRGSELDARMDVAGDDEADLRRRRFIVVGGRRGGDVDKPQRRLIERGDTLIEAELAGESPRRDVVIAEDEDQRRRRHPIAKGPKLRHDVRRAAARGMQEIAENEHPGHAMIADERLEAGEIALRRALGDRNPGPAKRGRLAEMEIGDEERPRRGEQRPTSREEKYVGGGRRPGQLARDTRIPSSSDDGERGNHAASPRENVGRVASRSTVAATAKLGQRRGTWSMRARASYASASSSRAISMIRSSQPCVVSCDWICSAHSGKASGEIRGVSTITSSSVASRSSAVRKR